MHDHSGRTHRSTLERTREQLERASLLISRVCVLHAAQLCTLYLPHPLLDRLRLHSRRHHCAVSVRCGTDMVVPFSRLY